MSGTLTGYRYGPLVNGTWCVELWLGTLSEAMVGLVGAASTDGEHRLAYVTRSTGELVEKLGRVSPSF